ncbi:sulfur carrier protein ThiS [Shouchella shacheensis]|uniref:sulfur carrier protein ThiS n=1 Tax=Shouchella shacheensis TaxID=1649580 RepID=UPI00074001D8|nr:sulfur carrier protein ThiS [Shouchella shacheensis]
MKLIVNGEAYELDLATLDEVVGHFQLDPQLVVIEVDGQIVDRANWASTELQDHMKIELVHFVGGG